MLGAGPCWGPLDLQRRHQRSMYFAHSVQPSAFGGDGLGPKGGARAARRPGRGERFALIIIGASSAKAPGGWASYWRASKESPFPSLRSSAHRAPPRAAPRVGLVERTRPAAMGAFRAPSHGPFCQPKGLAGARRAQEPKIGCAVGRRSLRAPGCPSEPLASYGQVRNRGHAHGSCAARDRPEPARRNDALENARCTARSTQVPGRSRHRAPAREISGATVPAPTSERP